MESKLYESFLTTVSKEVKDVSFLLKEVIPEAVKEEWLWPQVYVNNSHLL